jgi:prephenate dehydratase
MAFLTGKIRRKLGPSALHKYDIQFFNIDHCDICRVQVWPSKEFVFWDNHFFCRVDNSTRSLTCEEFLKYLKNKGMI